MTALDALYRDWLPGLWNADPDTMPARAERIFAPDALAHWAPGKEYTGPAEIAAQVQETWKLFDDIKVTLEHGPLVDGDLVAARWSFRGRLSDGVSDVPAPAGTRVHYYGMDLMRAGSDRFVEYWPFGDNLTLMGQLGVVDA